MDSCLNYESYFSILTGVMKLKHALINLEDKYPEYFLQIIK